MTFKYFAEVGGWRFCCIVKRGRKKIKLLDVTTFDTYEIEVRDEKILIPYKSRGTAKIIKDKRALYKKLGLSYPKAAVRMALENLKGGA